MSQNLQSITSQRIWNLEARLRKKFIFQDTPNQVSVESKQFSLNLIKMLPAILLIHFFDFHGNLAHPFINNILNTNGIKLLIQTKQRTSIPQTSTCHRHNEQGYNINYNTPRLNFKTTIYLSQYKFVPNIPSDTNILKNIYYFSEI